MRKGDWITEGTGESKTVVGQEVKFKINKNKTAPPFRTGVADFYMDENEAGVDIGDYDNFKAIVVESISWGLIERRGAYYYLDGKEKGIQGQENLIEYLKENPEIVENLREKIMNFMEKSK